MKQISLVALLLVFLSSTIVAQTNNETINRKGDLYLGAEVGTNKITSFSNNEKNNSLQGGILAEYYFAKQWSVLGRVKYFQTGVSFIKNTSNSFNYSDYSYNRFDGATISVPINVKWEYRIYKSLKGYIKQGFVYNYETKSEYNFSPKLDTNNAKSFGSLNAGFGFNYFASNKTAFFIDIETYQLGGHKGSSNTWFFPKNYYTTNSLINVGIKYNLKNNN